MIKSGGSEPFPETRISLIDRLRHSQESLRDQAIETLVTLYWLPVYKYVRIKWKKPSEDAQDLTQAFFTRALEKNFFETYDPSKARFRTFLRVCVDGFVANEHKAAKALKRGGTAQMISLDFEAVEKELVEFQNQETPEQMYEKEWVRSVLAVSLEKFREECERTGKLSHYRLFERYEIDSEETISYKLLASEFGISVSQVTNFLADARRQFRKAVLQTLRECTGSEEEFRSEARLLLRIEIS